jgi:tetratricopeptide (TPR) repeat protein
MKYLFWLPLAVTSAILCSAGVPSNAAGIERPGARLTSDRMISLMANSAEDFYNQGNEKYQAGDLPGALQAFEEALKLQPKMVDALVNSANILDDLGKTSEAIERYGLALALNKSDSNIYYNRGLAYTRFQQYPKALNDYNKAIAIDPASALFYSARALLKYEKLNDKKGGLQDLKTAADLYQKQGDQSKLTETMQLYKKLSS